MVHFGNSWDALLKDEFNKAYYKNLHKFLYEEYKTQKIHPDMYDIFNSLKYTDYGDVKVVILGQDPYHQPGQAHAFVLRKKGSQSPAVTSKYLQGNSRGIGTSYPLARRAYILDKAGSSLNEHRADRPRKLS